MKELSRKYKEAQKNEKKLDAFRAKLNALDYEEQNFLKIIEKEKAIKKAKDNREKLLTEIDKRKEKELALENKIIGLRGHLNHLEPWREELEKARISKEVFICMTMLRS